jgi:hypothetical protein
MPWAHVALPAEVADVRQTKAWEVVVAAAEIVVPHLWLLGSNSMQWVLHMRNCVLHKVFALGCQLSPNLWFHSLLPASASQGGGGRRPVDG